MSLNFSLDLMNSIVQYIESVPFSVIDNLQLSVSDVVFLYGILLFITLWLVRKKAKIILLVLSLILLSQIRSVFVASKKVPRLIFYNQPKMNYIGIYSNRENYLLYAGNQHTHNDIINYYFKNHWLKSDIKTNINIIDFESVSYKSDSLVKTISLHKIYLPNKQELIIYNKSVWTTITKIKSKYLFVCNNVWPPKNKIFSEEIILGNNLSRNQISAWENYAQLYNRQIHIISEEGAYDIELNEIK
jgi:hypothetical protein